MLNTQTPRTALGRRHNEEECPACPGGTGTCILVTLSEHGCRVRYVCQVCDVEWVRAESSTGSGETVRLVYRS